VTTESALKRTPLHDVHVSLGGKIVPFAGYEMPVQYPTGITAEHKAVRERAGLFDVSHMGEFIVQGPAAIDFVNSVTTNNAAALAVGQVQYSSLLNDRGTFVDDCLVYRFADHVMVVVNASNAAKDWAHIQPRVSGFDCLMTTKATTPRFWRFRDRWRSRSCNRSPTSTWSRSSTTTFPPAPSRRARCRRLTHGIHGEDGFELYFNPRMPRRSGRRSPPTAA
jgi:aminomethyltransferase